MLASATALDQALRQFSPVPPVFVLKISITQQTQNVKRKSQGAQSNRI
jgi:hypothetical protein